MGRVSTSIEYSIHVDMCDLPWSVAEAIMAETYEVWDSMEDHCCPAYRGFTLTTTPHHEDANYLRQQASRAIDRANNWKKFLGLK